MAKVIKKESFEKRMSLPQRLTALTQELDVTRAPSDAKVVSRGSHALREEANTVLDEAKKRALRLMDAAQKLLGEIEAKTELDKKRGYEEGYEEGLAEVTERLTAVGQTEKHFFADIEPKLMQLVYSCAEKIIIRELKENKDTVLAMIREALREISGSSITIRVHPQDYKLVKERESELLQALDALSTVTVKEDPAIKERGGCVIESPIGTIDAQLSTQLAAIKKALNLE